MFNVRERIASKWAMAKKHLMLVLVFVGILWAVFIVDTAIPDDWLKLTDFGIRARTAGGLFGIPAAPFLHADMFHLMGNTPFLVLLGWIVAMSGRAVFLRVFLVTALVSGAGAWVFGKGDLPHVGVSGVLYGMIGFLLARGWFARRLLWTLVALIVGILHLSQLLMLFRNDPGLSWACHFWGFVGGIALAWWTYGRTPGPVPSSATAPQPPAPAPPDMRRQ